MTSSGFIGKHLVYTYDNGWNYEIYVKNGHTLDYPYSQRHRRPIRWVKDQEAYIVRVGGKYLQNLPGPNRPAPTSA